MYSSLYLCGHYILVTYLFPIYSKVIFLGFTNCSVFELLEIGMLKMYFIIFIIIM